MSSSVTAPSIGSDRDRAHGADLIVAVETFAANTLRAQALDVDRHGVPHGRVDDFAELGLLNHTAPVEFGGSAIKVADDRRVHEVISGGCFNTWLVWAQHAPFVGRLATLYASGADVPPRALDVLRGQYLIGAAISDIRRYPDHFISAVREPSGWRLSGTISWVSGWGLNRVLVVAAVEPSTERVITAFVPVGEGFRAEELTLAAVGGSRTARVYLDDLLVDDADVISVEPLESWRGADRSLAADAKPHHFGLAHAVLDELEAAPLTHAQSVAARWRPRVQQLRSDAYGLADEALATGEPSHRLAERIAGKVAVGEALSALSRALVIARSGHALGSDDTAQLYARSALFLLVQGQNAEVRAAALTQLSR